MAEQNTIITRYNEEIKIGENAWTAMIGSIFDRVSETATPKKAPAEIHILDIVKEKQNKTVAFIRILDSTDCTCTWPNRYAIVPAEMIFTCKEDVIAHLIQHVRIHEIDDDFNNLKAEGWKSGDIAYVYNYFDQKTYPCRIIEIQDAPLHGLAILSTIDDPNAAYAFASRERRGKKVICRVDSLHKSPNKDEWGKETEAKINP